MPLHDAFAILHTADLERAVEFYVERLGFEERYRFFGFVLLGLDTFELGLTAVEEVSPPGRVALWLYSEDVDAEIDALCSIRTATRSSSASGCSTKRTRALVVHHLQYPGRFLTGRDQGDAGQGGSDARELEAI